MCSNSERKKFSSCSSSKEFKFSNSRSKVGRMDCMVRSKNLPDKLMTIS